MYALSGRGWKASLALPFILFRSIHTFRLLLCHMFKYNPHIHATNTLRSAHLQYHLSNLISLHSIYSTTHFVSDPHTIPCPRNFFSFFFLILQLSFFSPYPSSQTVCTNPVIPLLRHFHTTVRTQGWCSTVLFFLSVHPSAGQYPSQGTTRVNEKTKISM